MFEQFQNSRIWVRLVAVIAALLVFAWGVMIVWTVIEQRRVAITQAKDMALSVHQMTMANLLFMKVTKTIKDRNLYYEQVRETELIKDLRVLRGALVVTEHGPGDAIAMNPDALEKQVMDSGKGVFEEVNDPKAGHVLRAIFPAVAKKNYLGKNCLKCHSEADEGQILGAVSMKISLTGIDKAVTQAEIKLILAALAITIPLLGFIYFFVTRVVSRPLSAMTENLQDIAQGEGDLTKRLPVKGRDEIGQASEAFNLLMEKLRALIGRISQTANNVAVSARSLQATGDQIATSSSTQTEESAAAAESMEAISSSISSVAQASNEVESLSQESQSRTQAGAANMDTLKTHLQEIEKAVSQIASTVETFVERTTSISTITQQVKDVANQTNLLALNAAIEAARAGEQGRGFAVVADEVRKLAEKSALSANEIDGITHILGGESIQVREAIGHGLSVLQASQASMVSVSEALQEASVTVNQMAQGMVGIRSATSDQTATGATVAARVESIASLARENADTISKMTDATSHLANLANDLQAEMAKFKI